MASTTTRYIMVKAPPQELSKAVRQWWEELVFEEKAIKLDILPNRFWGTFTHREDGGGGEKSQLVHIYVSVEDGSSLGDFGYTGYGRNFLKISCLIPDPVLGNRAVEYMTGFMEFLKNLFGGMGIQVEMMET